MSRSSGLLILLALGSLARAAESPQYQGPAVLAVGRDGRCLYAACQDACQVTWVELPGGRILRRVDVPAAPTGLALVPDGSTLIVTCAGPKSSVLVLDAESGRQLAAIPAGHTAVAPVVGLDGRRVYVANRFDNDVSVIDLAAGRELARLEAVREPIASAITPDGKLVLVANHLPRTRTDADYRGDVSPVITVIDTATNQTGSILMPHGASSLRGICVAPDGRHAYVTHLLSNFEMIPFRVDTGWINVNVVSVIDLGRREVVRTAGLDEYDRGAANPWDVRFAADGHTLCVSASGTHELCVIDEAMLLSDAGRTMSPMMAAWPIYTSLGDSFWRRIALPGKGPRGLAAVGSKVFAAQYFSDTVAVADLAAHEGTRAGSIALGPPPRLTHERRGELLFHDAAICFQEWQTCASCHPDARTDALVWDLLNDGIGNPKSTKSMLLAHRTPPDMSEGVRISAEEAVRSGIMHILFADRPEDEPAAIDAYLISLRPVPSPHLVDGRLSPAAERGRKLFHSPRVGCNRCHPAPLYTDMLPHDVQSKAPNEHTRAFDTPTLVEVWRTAPYLHDGRYATIRELLVEGRHGLTPHALEKLTPAQIDDMVEFVLSL